MALFAIADLHLSFGVDKPMDVFEGWYDYQTRLETNWRALVGAEDTVVIAGDVSWGMSLEEARPDFSFLDSLPGQKLLLKGNHDYWWTTRKKVEQFWKSNGFSSLSIVHNDCRPVEGRYAVCGTRGWMCAAPTPQDQKIIKREAGRLQRSLEAAQKTGLEPVVFLHYPPVFAGAACEDLLSVLTDAGVRRCYYGHLHSTAIRHAVTGDYRGIRLELISGDAVGFTPVRVF